MTKAGLIAVLVAVAAAVPAQSQTSRVSGSAQSDIRELPADQQIMQALNRLTFGPRPGDIQKVRAIGLDKWIDNQLHPERIDDSAIESFMTKYSALNENQNDLLKQYAQLLQARRTAKKDPQSELANAK